MNWQKLQGHANKLSKKIYPYCLLVSTGWFDEAEPKVITGSKSCRTYFAIKLKWNSLNPGRANKLNNTRLGAHTAVAGNNYKPILSSRPRHCNVVYTN